MPNDLQMARGILERAIKDCVELGLGHFHTATETYPTSITVRLGDLVHVNNLEVPNVTVTVG